MMDVGVNSFVKLLKYNAASPLLLSGSEVFKHSEFYLYNLIIR